MKYALISNGMVTNIINADPSFIQTNFSSLKDNIIVDVTSKYVGIGFAFDGINFTAPIVAEDDI